jgi:ribosomal protein L37E
MTRDLNDRKLPNGLPYELKRTMQEVIHKCLRCNAIAYEIQSQSYYCSHCGFEWEVI